MKALILAAGRGTRIRSVHGERPKCLIPISDDGETILDQQMENLVSAGVSDIGVVVGYQMNHILDHVRARNHKFVRRVQFFKNARFAETNNIYSLWLACDWLMGDSFVCLNGDVVFDSRVLMPALTSQTPVTMIVDSEWRGETMKVIVNDGRIVRMSKGIPRGEFSGTNLGITAFSSEILPRFFGNVEALIQCGRVNDFFNTAVQQLVDESVHVSPSPTWGLPWAEIDDPGDLEFARKHVFPRLRHIPLAA